MQSTLLYAAEHKQRGGKMEFSNSMWRRRQTQVYVVCSAHFTRKHGGAIKLNETSRSHEFHGQRDTADDTKANAEKIDYPAQTGRCAEIRNIFSSIQCYNSKLMTEHAQQTSSWRGMRFP